MHTQTKEQTAMDATRHNTIITAVIIGFTGLMFTACTTSTEPQSEPVAIEYATGDQYGAAAQALAELNTYLRTVTTTTTTVVPVAPAITSAPATNFDWDALAICESGGDWSYPPVAGGFSGGLMFHIGTWRAMGGTEYAPDAYLATREQQIDVAERTKAAAGGSMRPWPGCARKHGWL